MKRLFVLRKSEYLIGDSGQAFAVTPDCTLHEVSSIAEVNAEYAAGHCRHLGRWYTCRDCPIENNIHLEEDWIKLKRDGILITIRDSSATNKTATVCERCRRRRLKKEHEAINAHGGQQQGGIKIEGQQLPYNKKGVGKPKSHADSVAEYKAKKAALLAGAKGA
jgi:hypothetical protein